MPEANIPPGPAPVSEEGEIQQSVPDNTAVPSAEPSEMTASPSVEQNVSLPKHQPEATSVQDPIVSSERVATTPRAPTPARVPTPPAERVPTPPPERIATPPVRNPSPPAAIP